MNYRHAIAIVALLYFGIIAAVITYAEIAKKAALRDHVDHSDATIIGVFAIVIGLAFIGVTALSALKFASNKKS